MEILNFLLDNILLWFVFSILVFVLWTLMMGDPGTSDTGNTILTIICAILALPLTIVIVILVFILELILEYDSRRNDPDV